MSAALEFRSVKKSYGTGLRVLDGVSFSLAAGEVVILVGENGAGKTTCFDVASGLVTPDGGEIWMAGRPVQGLSPWAIVRRGLRRMYQTPAIYASVSVRDNVLIGVRPTWYSLPVPWPFCRARDRLWQEVRGLAPALCEACPFLEGARRPAGELSFGQQRVVEFLRVHATVARGGVRVVLLDEPFTGIHHEVERLMVRMVEDWAASGTSVLLIEHPNDRDLLNGRRRLCLEGGVVR